MRLLLALMLVPMAAAMDPTPENPTLWMHATSAGGCCTYWSNADQADANHTIGTTGYVRPLPVVNPVENPGSPVWLGGVDRWTLAMDPPLSTVLDLDGDIEVTAVLGGDADPPEPDPNDPFALLPRGIAGQALVSTDLIQGETVVAWGEAKPLEFVNEWVTVAWTIAPNVTRVDPADGNLVWRITVTGAGPLVSASMNNETGWTRLVLPLKEKTEAPRIIYHELTDTLTRSFTTATTETHHYNLTASGKRILDISANVQEGKAVLTIRDAKGELVKRTITKDLDETVEVDGQGAWTATIDAQGFRGGIEVAFRSPPPPVTTTQAPPPTSQPPATSTSEPAQTQFESKGSPGFALMGAVMALGWAARRHR